MTVSLALLVFLGGVLTILSPCILPVLPFVFARAEQPFLRNGLPLLLGMALTFALVATLAAVGGAWAVHINQYGRFFALIVLGALALTLLWPRFAEVLARPFVAAGDRLSRPASGAGTASSGISRSALLGVATGLLWAPCAGPILGLVLTGAAISGPTPRTTVLLLAYAAGACASLALALLAGRRVFTAMKGALGVGEWIRRALGVAVLLGVVAVAFNWDSGILSRLSFAHTDRLEQSLLKFVPPDAAASATSVQPSTAPSGEATAATDTPLAALSGATGWLNSPPLTAASLRGKVVLVDFWTYSCINCLRSLPYVKAWYEKYKDHGLVVIGAHSPEFAFEKDPENVRRAVGELGISYPVALDNQYAIWRGFDNRYWPAHFFIDAKGQVRSHHFGEGEYAQSEQTIRQLLTEAGYRDLPAVGGDDLRAAGLQAPADAASAHSPETYLGYARAERFGSPGGLKQGQAVDYSYPSSLATNQWALQGRWLVDKEEAVLAGSGGAVAFRFRGRDLHLVLAPSADGHPVRFRVLLDGAPPAADHGADTDSDGYGVVREQRLYQLIRQSVPGQERSFTIQFPDEGVRAYAFTFG
jgi:cytochrome c biogenesis protein CcdA/thiol-disulfide isomerase/thioredoxin